MNLYWQSNAHDSVNKALNKAFQGSQSFGELIHSANTEATLSVADHHSGE
jgi:hypothetical protein